MDPGWNAPPGMWAGFPTRSDKSGQLYPTTPFTEAYKRIRNWNATCSFCLVKNLVSLSQYEEVSEMLTAGAFGWGLILAGLLFMYASLDVRKWNDSSSGSGYLSQRYGTYDETGVHGVLIVEPGGYHWNVCEIDNDSADGKQFGASVKVQRPISGSGYAGYSYNGTGYWKWYYYPVHTYTRPDREALNFGAGQVILLG